MQRKTIILWATLATLALGGAIAWPFITFYTLTGHFKPIQNIETLQNPVAVTNWSSDGLHLEDGRTLQLPGFRSLPSNSPALKESTKRGVEVQTDGHVWGLVKVHHWCGNDPVREHIARVDLSDMMLFLRVGEPAAAVPEADFLVAGPGGKFTVWGWRVEEFLEFQAWVSIKNSAR